MKLRHSSHKRRYQQILNHLWTTAELKIGAIFGCLWAIFDMAIGGIDTPIKALAILMVLDFITGVSAGYRAGALSSRTGAKGIWKKAGIFVCIMFAYLLDCATNMQMFRGMVISGFAIIEAMSLIENIDRMGYGWIIPSFLRAKLQQISEEKHITEKKEGDINGSK